MAQSAKIFSQRLNQCLDDTDAPNSIRERAVILGKMLDISKHIAWNMLEGHQLPEPEVIQHIASEFEVESKWLSGEIN